MYFKVFTYNYQEALDFINWWINSGYFSVDIKKGDNVQRGMGVGGLAVRDVYHTIRVLQGENFDLFIEKGVITSDAPQRELKYGEDFLNQNVSNLEEKGMSVTGFDVAISIVEDWLQEVWDCDPYFINEKKATTEQMRFDFIGVGFYIETYHDDWKIHVSADVVGFPK